MAFKAMVQCQGSMDAKKNNKTKSQNNLSAGGCNIDIMFSAPACGQLLTFPTLPGWMLQSSD